jgi:hypothetical protein
MPYVDRGECWSGCLPEQADRVSCDIYRVVRCVFCMKLSNLFDKHKVTH